MSSRNIGLPVGRTAAKANGGTSGAGGGAGSVVTNENASSGNGAGTVSMDMVSGTLPLTERELPPPDTKRWVMRRKAEVVAGVRCGLISLDEACRRYTLSVEEFLSWQRLIDSHGVRGLRATRLQDYRPRGPDDEEDGDARMGDGGLAD